MPTEFPTHPENDPQPNEGAKPQPAGDPGAYTQEIKHQQVTARVPEKVSKGVFSTGAMVLQGPYEFMIDFVLRMNQPHMVVARVIMPFALVPNVINAMRDNLANYNKRFGPPPSLPTPPPMQNPPTIEEIYDQLKLPDDQLAGDYCNAVMISHTPSEFCFDFITNFYPKSAVSCRVFLAAAQVPRFLETLTRSFQQFQQKVAQQQQQRPPLPPGSPIA